MKQTIQLELSNQELKRIVKDALREVVNENRKPPKLYSINKVAKMLGRSHTTIKKQVESGQIKSTPDGLIPEDAIEEYLNG